MIFHDEWCERLRYFRTQSLKDVALENGCTLYHTLSMKGVGDLPGVLLCCCEGDRSCLGID